MKRIQGVILKSIDYGEASKIIYLFTKEGIESVLVKGVKKLNSKFKGLILNYNHVLCYTSDAKLPILTDIDLIEEYKNIKCDLNKNKSAGKIVKVLYQTKYDNNKLYDLFLKTLTFIDKDDEEYYLIAFLIKNTYFLGITPNFSCQCQSDKYIGFNIQNGSIVCPSCGISCDIDIETTYLLNSIYFSKLEEKIEINKKEMFDFIQKYYQYHASIAL